MSSLKKARVIPSPVEDDLLVVCTCPICGETIATPGEFVHQKGDGNLYIIEHVDINVVRLTPINTYESDDQDD